jgi:hypothetical protein
LSPLPITLALLLIQSAAEAPPVAQQGPAGTALGAEELKTCVTGYRVVRTLRGETPATANSPRYKLPARFEAVQASPDNWARREDAAVAALRARPDGERVSAEALRTGGITAAVIGISVTIKDTEKVNTNIANISRLITRCDVAFGFKPPLNDPAVGP